MLCVNTSTIANQLSITENVHTYVRVVIQVSGSESICNGTLIFRRNTSELFAEMLFVYLLWLHKGQVYYIQPGMPQIMLYTQQNLILKHQSQAKT